MTPAHTPDLDSPAWYREDHCVLRWPMVAAGLIAPGAALAAAVLGVVLSVILRSQPIAWVMMGVMLAAMAFWLIRGQLLLHWWPIGIRLRQDGVAIGGVRWAERHPGKTRRKASVLNQGCQVFSCPWDGVVSVQIETGRDRLKDLKRKAPYGRRETPLGNLAVPFMTAALIIRVNPGYAVFPAIHPARNPLAYNYASPGYRQNEWVVPTRHPERLATALVTAPLPADVVIDPGVAALQAP